MTHTNNSSDAAGFTSKQAYKMGIPSIGIVAVLVANVTFIAWATPPGAAVLLLYTVNAWLTLCFYIACT